MDPIAEGFLLSLARNTPQIILAIADALRGGDTPEEAIAKARRLTPPRLDTTFEDDAARARIRGAGQPPNGVDTEPPPPGAGGSDPT